MRHCFHLSRVKRLVLIRINLFVSAQELLFEFVAYFLLVQHHSVRSSRLSCVSKDISVTLPKQLFVDLC